MKRYLLLRDNKETGPHSLDELVQLTLKPHDLVWVEGRSGSWLYPYEVDELKAYVQKPRPTRTVKDPAPATAKHIFVCLPQKPVMQDRPASFATAAPLGDPDEPVLETKYARSLDDLAYDYAESLKKNKKRYKHRIRRASSIWVLGLLSALVFSAFIVTDVFQGPDRQMMVAGDFKKEEASHLPDPEANNYEPAPTPAEPVRMDANEMVGTTLSDYQVGFFGGISQLRLTVENKSELQIDKLVIELQYLRSNGAVARTEQHSFFYFLPHDRKSISVPDSKKGVKVIYKVKELQTRPVKTQLRVV